MAQGGDRPAFAVRLEPGRGSGWTEAARALDPVLPDARPLQVDLDRPGNADDGHVAMLAGPDAARDRHGAPGDDGTVWRAVPDP